MHARVAHHYAGSSSLGGMRDVEPEVGAREGGSRVHVVAGACRRLDERDVLEVAVVYGHDRAGDGIPDSVREIDLETGHRVVGVVRRVDLRGDLQRAVAAAGAVVIERGSGMAARSEGEGEGNEENAIHMSSGERV